MDGRATVDTTNAQRAKPPKTSPGDRSRIGERLGNLRLERLIAEGGMGLVYEARHVLLGRAQAVKLLHSSLARDPKIYERFLREAKVSATLDSDHVVPVREFGTAIDGTPYFVMDLLEGEDLASLLRTSAPLPVSRAVELLLHACRGLQVAHEHDPPIVHRDLKPANLFVYRRRDGTELLKILDFGIAKFLEPDPDDSGTRAGVVIGTPHYMSPEQAEGANSIDCRTDIYALGAILYEALSGHKAHPGNAYKEVVSHILLKKPAPLETLRADLPPGLVTVIRRAMAPDLSERVASVAQLAEALVPFRHDAPSAEAAVPFRHAVPRADSPIRLRPNESPDVPAPAFGPSRPPRLPQPPSAPTLVSDNCEAANDREPPVARHRSSRGAKIRAAALWVGSIGAAIAGFLATVWVLFSRSMPMTLSIRIEATPAPNPGFPIAQCPSSPSSPVRAPVTCQCRNGAGHRDGLEADPLPLGFTNLIVDSSRDFNWFPFNSGAPGLQNIRYEGDRACTTGKGFRRYGGLGLYLDRAGKYCPPCAFDASKYQALRFRLTGKLRGGRFRFGLGTAETLNADEGGVCTAKERCNDHHGIELDLAAGPLYLVPFDKLKQNGWGSPASWDPQTMIALTWTTEAYRGSPNGSPSVADFEDLCVDRIEFVRTP